MRSALRAMTLAAMAILWTGAAAADVAGKTDIPVKQVVLFSSGVGYFQHAGTVTGDTTAQLSFKAEQINDVLKSLVLQDTGGTVGDVTYASQDPLEKTLKSFGVDITDNPSLDQLLNQLRGARVTLVLATEQATGTILGVEKRVKPGGNNTTYEVPVVNLLDGASIRSVELGEVRNIRLEDAALQDELTKALAALAQARDKDKKPVTVHFKGNGPREVLLGYVVETPVWKTSYRLVLGGKDVPSKLQGWAIVENQTDNDWNGVQLSLVSGRPLSFIENLYEPVYVQRPVLVTQRFALARESLQQLANGAVQQQAKAQTMGGYAANDSVLLKTDDEDGAAGRPLNPVESILAMGSATTVGELFEYSVGSVNLPRQSSAMIPIVTDSINAERISVFKPNILPRNPFNGARLKNTTGKHLPAGPMTVLEEGTYAGDAHIDDLPPGQDRLITFGIDQQMTVDSTGTGNSQEILAGKINDGVLYVTRKSVYGNKYTAANKSDHDKSLVIELPRQGGWDLVDSPDPIEKTDAYYRFQISVKSGQNADLSVKFQSQSQDTIGILGNDADGLLIYNSEGAIPKDVKDALQKAADLKHAAAEAQKKLDADKTDEQGIVDDQHRINDTLRTISQTTQLYSRLLGKLNDQETQLEKLRADEDSLKLKIADLQKQLSDYLTHLNLG